MGAEQTASSLFGYSIVMTDPRLMLRNSASSFDFTSVRTHRHIIYAHG